MDFQAVVDSMHAATCVVSVENFGDGNYGKLRIVTGNKPYINSIEHPFDNVQMLTKKFVPNSEYTDYLTRNLNFEDACYNAAVLKKNIHAYAHPDRFDVWFDMSFIPLSYEKNGLCYCLYMMEINFKPDAKRLSTISADVATSVLETCIKLRSYEDFKATMKIICEDLRDMCSSEHCCILLMDNVQRRCSVLCEAFSPESKLLPMENYIDDNFFAIAESWKGTIAGSNCIIVKNKHDMDVVKERNPVWHDSITSAGGKTIVLFPLEFKNEILGYMWAINFDPNLADTIKETLELTTFILASEIYSYQLLKRLNVLSSTDMLTNVMNRNEMNNYVDQLIRSSSGKSVGVIFADLNGLKVINDSEGHAAGDTLLKNAALALREVFPVNCIYRAGGDEFVVILTDITERELLIKSQRIRETAMHYKDLVFAVGVAYTSDSKDIRIALHIADERMYEDKKRYYELHPDKKRSSTVSN